MQKMDFKTDKLSEEHIKEMERHHYDRSKIDQQYNELCHNYEDIYLRVGWPDPKKCADFVNELYS
jgi:hypothetical protein